ncbi:peroxisomal ATPase PEX6 [Antennarius striatus]|uniref:peroxisomal ATPase PEX6 n=1 Tax=Antennarius striatus TaxID=241820 RepID=UPI0035AE6B9B
MTQSKMAAQVELCCVDSFPPHLSPLDGLMLRSELGSVFRSAADPPTLLLSPQRPDGSAQPGILLLVHPATEEELAGCWADTSPGRASGRRVRLFTSPLFLQHHRLQQLGSTGTARVLEPVSLDRVVLGARCSLLRRPGAQLLPAALLELCRPGRWLLARRGDPLLVPGGNPGQVGPEEPGQVLLTVLDCKPVAQGRITADTSLVVTDWDPPEPPTPRGPPAARGPPTLCVSDFAQLADGLRGGPSLLDNRKLLDGGPWGGLQALEGRLEVRVGDTHRWAGLRSQGGVFVDVDSCVFVGKRLLLQLGLFNQEWVRLWRGGASSRGGGASSQRGGAPRERLVSVQVVDSGPELQPNQEHGVVSRSLWFNLTGGHAPDTPLSVRVKRWSPSPGGRGSDTPCRWACPPWARELRLQPVVTPPRGERLSCDQLLSEHFSTPRLVSVGDVLSVPAGAPPELQEASEGIHRCPVLFFRVQGVCPSAPNQEEGGGAFLADRHHTSLYLGLSTNSSVPWPVGGASEWSSQSPAGLSRAVEVLSAVILPHLRHSSALSGCTVLLHGPAGSGKVTAVSAVSRRLNLHLLKVDAVGLCADTPAAAEARLAVALERADALQPCILLLRNLQLLLGGGAGGGAEEDGRLHGAFCQRLAAAPHSVVVVATVRRRRDLAAGVTAAFVHQVALEEPTAEQRLAALDHLTRDLELDPDISLERLSRVTAGFQLGELRVLLVGAGRSACRRLRQSCAGQREEDLCSSGVTLQDQDFSRALETLQDARSSAVGAPKIPDVRWEDVGGLQRVRGEVLDTVQLPLLTPQLRAPGLTRTGLLLYGPPGTGKTLLAKAVATECSMTFLSVKGPELLNMYVGQSEENVRAVFHRARSAAPCVVFFDELDSLAPSRGRSGDSGGVMDRVVSQLLAELDALQASAGVFVIGATNRPDLLDQSLLRPGRFDKLVYVGLNEDRASQLQVLQAVLRKFQLDSDVDLQEILDQCPAHMTGADLYALCSDAMTAAIKRKVALICDGLDSQNSPLLVSGQDFSAALRSFRPSVSERELLRYQDLHQRLTAC